MNVLTEFDIPILSEEGKDTPYAQRKDWERFWVVDPLDGTKEFIKRNGEFTVNIALIENSRPLLGTIFVPDRNTLYFAAQDLVPINCKMALSVKYWVRRQNQRKTP